MLATRSVMMLLLPIMLMNGRAATLIDVFLRHRHPRESGWSTAEVGDLAAFLKTL